MKQLEFMLGLPPAKEKKDTEQRDVVEEKYNDPTQRLLPFYEFTEKYIQYEMDRLGVYW